MSFGKKISRFFYNHAESAEKHWDEELKTHYYKTTRDKGLSKLEEIIRSSKHFKINSISQEHGEISFQVVKGRKAFVIATVIMVRPYQTAIDFTVTSEGVLPFDFGYSAKIIKQLYEIINKELSLIDKNKN